MKMIATKSFSYAGKSRRPGDDFDVANRDAKLLAAIKRAKPAPPSPVKRDMAPEQSTIPQGDERKPRKGRYRRRDVRAEDDATEA